MPARPDRQPRHHRRRSWPLPAAAAALLLAGCGNERTPPPDVTTPATPAGTAATSATADGLRFAAPRGWRVQRGAPPLVATVSAGRAVLSIFRYPRLEPLPRTPKALDAAAEALTGAAKQRDGTWTETKRARLRIDGRPAIVLRGTQTVAGEPRTVRSTHVYAFGGEVVVDAFAPAGAFTRADAEVFRPLVRSLQLSRPPG